MRMMYARVTTMQPDEVEAAIGSADVVLLNWGLHYQVDRHTHAHNARTHARTHARTRTPPTHARAHRALHL